MTRYTARVTRQSGERTTGWLVFHEVGESSRGLPETYLYATFHADDCDDAEMLDMSGYFTRINGKVTEAVMFDANVRHTFEIHDCKENAEA